MLPELIYYFARLARSRRRGHHPAERVLNAEVLCVRYLIGQIVKVYDYINRIDKRFCLAIFKGYEDTLSLSLLCITMILRVRRIFFEITAFPNSVKNRLDLNYEKL